MGSSPPNPTTVVEAAALSLGPETLARVVLRCRELERFIEASRSELPARGETPFLYGQLDDVLQRLQTSLRQLVPSADGADEKGGGFLRRLTSKKTRETPRRNAPRYDLEGSAWTIPVTELVGFLSHTGKSGLLWVTSPSETFVLEFARGSLVHATSNAPPAAFRLGEILLKEKLLAPEELARLIENARAADDMLGSYLVRCGRLSHADLQRALAIQVQQLFHRLMDAESATYRFQEGAQLVRTHSLEVNITQLLLESARQKDEQRERAVSRDTPAGQEPPPSGLELLDEPPGVAPRVAEASERGPRASASADEPPAPLPGSAPEESARAPEPEASAERSEAQAEHSSEREVEA